MSQTEPSPLGYEGGKIMEILKVENLSKIYGKGENQVKAILISILFVAVVITIIMKYSMSKINKQNIIETIRNDNI